MKVGVTVLRHVVVEHNVHSLNIHTSAKQVGSDKYSLMEVLETLVAAQSRNTIFILKIFQQPTFFQLDSKWSQNDPCLSADGRVC